MAPLNHKPKRDLEKPVFDLAATKRMALKCISTGNQGTLDYLINNICVDDNGVYFKHEGDSNSEQNETRTQKVTG